MGARKSESPSIETIAKDVSGTAELLDLDPETAGEIGKVYWRKFCVIQGAQAVYTVIQKKTDDSPPIARIMEECKLTSEEFYDALSDDTDIITVDPFRNSLELMDRWGEEEAGA